MSTNLTRITTPRGEKNTRVPCFCFFSFVNLKIPTLRVLVTQVNHKDIEVLKMYYGQRHNSKVVDIPYRRMPQTLLNSSLVKYLDDTTPMAQQYARITNEFYEYLSLIGGSTLWTVSLS